MVIHNKYNKNKKINSRLTFQEKKRVKLTLKKRYNKLIQKKRKSRSNILKYNKTISSSLYLKKETSKKYLKLETLKNKKSSYLTALYQARKQNWILPQYYLKLILNKAILTQKTNMAIKWALKYHPYINKKVNLKLLTNLKKNKEENLKKRIISKFPNKVLQLNTALKQQKINKYKLTLNHNKNHLLKSNNNKLYNTLIKSRVMRSKIGKKPYNFLFESMTLRNMLELGFHLGCKKKYRNRNIEHFYGRYNVIQQHSFININLMVLNLRKGLNFIRYALIRNSQLMLVSWSKDLQRIPLKIYKQSFFFKGPWFPGFLSNFRNIRHHGSFWFKSKFFPKKKKRKQAPLTTLALSELGIKIFPNLLFTLDSLYVNESAINEALFLRMPSVAFINPTQFLDISQAIYPILGSCNTYKQGKFFIYLIAMLLLDVALYRKARIFALERNRKSLI